MTLLAKSDPNDPNYTLADHTSRVVAALSTLRGIWTALPAVLETAAIYHDMGKAASGFQRALREEDYRWKFRHEILSAQIFRDQFDISDTEMFWAFLAVLSHHKNLGMKQDGGYKLSQKMLEATSGDDMEWHKKWREIDADSLAKSVSAPIAVDSQT